MTVHIAICSTSPQENIYDEASRVPWACTFVASLTFQKRFALH